MNEWTDEDGYPTEECLEKIATWPYDDPMEWFDFIWSVWTYTDYWEKDDRAENELGHAVIRFEISTCGCSGNEDIIKAMQKNEMLWHLHWVQSRRGGHYIFEVEKSEIKR